MTPFRVHFEKPPPALADFMGDLRIWLDSNKIQPIEFKTSPHGGSVPIDVQFDNEDEATGLRRRFD